MPSPPASCQFPATDPGFAALPVAELLTSAADLIGRIRICFGLSRESFDQDVLPLLERYAAYVHLLPATADNYFSAPAGLLNLGLEVSFYSLQGTDAHIFSGRSTISSRRQLEPRWRLATFIGGLCCELHRVLSHLTVTDAAGDPWPQFLCPLADWLASRGADRYFLRWRPNAVESRGLGVFVLPLVVPARTMQFLSDDNAVIVPQLLASISGQPVHRDHNILDLLVRRSLALVIDRNLQANSDRYGLPQFGSHLERYLVDAMRRLAASNPSWMPNRDKSRAWLGRDGLFLLWPQAAHDLLALLESDQLVGIPKAPESVLDLMLEAGVFEPRPDGAPTWFVLPPDLKSAVEAVRLASPALLLTSLDPPPEPTSESLACAAGTTRAPPMPNQGTPPPVPSPRGTQLSLLESTLPTASDAPPSPAGTGPAAPAPQVAPTTTQAVPANGARPSPAPPAVAPFKLNAPMRLNPAVRAALDSIVQTLNGPGAAAAAAAVATGLFVPLREFEQRGVQPALAARALGEVGLLVPDRRAGASTVSQEFGGETTMGIVVLPTCIEGFESAAFVSAPTGAC